MDVLDRLTELIIPEDDYSPGAHAAEVNVYLDVVMSEANNGVKQRWCEGLAAAGEEPTGASTRSYPTAAPANWTKLSPPWPQTSKVPRPLSIALDRFFPLLKRATIDGYYTSKIGIHEDLQYQGNTAVSEFPGCTHKEH